VSELANSDTCPRPTTGGLPEIFHFTVRALEAMGVSLEYCSAV
jgi:hypothetical protein